MGAGDDVEGAGGGDDVHRGEQEEPRAEQPSEKEDPSAWAAARRRRRARARAPTTTWRAWAAATTG